MIFFVFVSRFVFKVDVFLVPKEIKSKIVFKKKDKKNVYIVNLTYDIKLI